MQAAFPGRHLLLVGFWSDWKYLNEVLLESVRGVHPAEVILVDPATDAELHAKAPDLWDWASRFGPHFRHIPQKAEVFLGELRQIVSRNILKRVLKAAAEVQPGVCDDFSVVCNALSELDTNALYALRRDFAGAPSGKAAKWKEPEDWMHAVAAAHLAMLSTGPPVNGSSYRTTHGKMVRVVNGRTLPMSKVRSEYSRDPSGNRGR